MSAADKDIVGMDYLQSLPRRWVVTYIPLGLFVFVLLFRFYWMGATSFKPNEELLSRTGNPFWIVAPTLAHFEELLFQTEYPAWLWNTVLVAVVSTFLSLGASVLAAYAIERLRFKGARPAGGAIFLAYLVPPSILFIPLATIVFDLELYDTQWALILTYPTFLIPFCTWLLMGRVRRELRLSRVRHDERLCDRPGDRGQRRPVHALTPAWSRQRRPLTRMQR